MTRPVHRNAAERFAQLALSTVPGVGPVTFARLVAESGSALAAFRRARRAAPPFVSGIAARELRRAAQADAVAVGERIASAAEGAGAAVLLVGDDGYPPALGDLGPPPPVLYLRGEVEAMAAAAVAVVGTRRPSGYGRSVAADLGDELGRAGLVVVSGLALGIDGITQAAAIEAGGRSVAVLPSPIDRVYPPTHAPLAERIVRTGGALVSEVPPGRLIGKPDFARRNRIIAGLAGTVVVVEAPDRSGALLTAQAAVQLGRDLWAVPGQIGAPQSQGTNRLIADQLATLLTSPMALVHQLGVAPSDPAGPPIGLSEVERRVLERVIRRSASIEELRSATGLETGPLAGALTLLEARGLVAAYAGATFHPTPIGRRWSARR